MEIVFHVLKPADGLHNWNRPRPHHSGLNRHPGRYDSQDHIVDIINTKAKRERSRFHALLREARAMNWPHKTTMMDGSSMSH